MAHQIIKTESIALQCCNPKLTVWNGNAHSSDITIELNDNVVAAGTNKLKDIALPLLENKNNKIFILAIVSKTGPTNHINLTLKFSCNNIPTDFNYATIAEEENVIVFKINIVARCNS